MTRAEERAKKRRTKGGSNMRISIHYGHQEPSFTPFLDYAVKFSHEENKKEALRSKQVPGY
jgi:hypothetical protein